MISANVDVLIARIVRSQPCNIFKHVSKGPLPDRTKLHRTVEVDIRKIIILIHLVVGGHDADDHIVQAVLWHSAVLHHADQSSTPERILFSCWAGLDEADGAISRCDALRTRVRRLTFGSRPCCHS